MTEQDKIIKSISLDNFKDPRVIKQIVYHPLLFAKRRMADPDDYRPIRIRYFGVFLQKYMRNKEMFKKLSFIVSNLKLHPKLIKIFVEPTFVNYLDAIKYVNELFESNNKDAINEIYDTIYKAIYTD
jgi:hypothetical protein